MIAQIECCKKVQLAAKYVMFIEGAMLLSIPMKKYLRLIGCSFLSLLRV